MTELSLKRLRELRARADGLLRNVDSDLRPFLHRVDNETFRRKPESLSIQDDVNVTTTCSCLMALALTNRFHKFYEPKSTDQSIVEAKARSIFHRLIDAPWMSSGLTENNAFSTTLVLRTYGFLKEQGVLQETSEAGSKWEKIWTLQFGITNVSEFADYINSKSDEPAQFLYSSLSDKSRILLDKPQPTSAQKEEIISHEKTLRAALALDLARLVASGQIYSKNRFPEATDATKRVLDTIPVGYALASINRVLLNEQFSKYFSPLSYCSMKEIADQLASDPRRFAINEYSTSATVVYWFVDGITRGGIVLENSSWESLCRWATNEFNRERSLVLAGHDAMMDPIAMAMAACLCAKLRVLTTTGAFGSVKAHREILPSFVELEHSVQELFKRQAPSGIWPKYFPLFHYQDAGSNFCFTFELMEAVLTEFGRTENTLLDQAIIIKGLEDAVTWCEKNRLKCSDGEEYSGWNSGGDIETLKKERPESWATAIVHMFLWELSIVLSHRIQKRVLEKYKVHIPKKSIEEKLADPNHKLEHFGKAVERLQDIQLFLRPQHVSLKKVLLEELLEANYGKTEFQLRRERATNPLSALLFGPPGTSKTQVTKAIAEDLGWPMVEINPSEFVKGSFDNVYLKADEIFTDLMDLAAVVILFDEMDALTQKRPSGDDHLDTATQFLTTSMLPKLTDLHDNGGAVFFMATNFQNNFDPAIKRAGRFDLLLCMGPPMLLEKLEKLDYFFDPAPIPAQKTKAVKLLNQYLDKSQKHKNILTLFTYGDFKSFLKGIGSYADIGDKLQHLGEREFLASVESYGETIGLKYGLIQQLLTGDSSLETLDKLPTGQLEKLLSGAGTENSDIGRYLLDRLESKRQS